MISRKFWEKFKYEPKTVFRALVDTGVWGSATCHKELIANYRKYSAKFPCPVRLCGATTDNGGDSKYIVPVGEGYILVPSRFPQSGIVQVKVYYSPHLTGTIINEEDLMDRVTELFVELRHKEDGIYFFYKQMDGEITLFSEFVFPEIISLLSIITVLGELPKKLSNDKSKGVFPFDFDFIVNLLLLVTVPTS